ncbi:MAG: hypothetical protein ACD_79C01315G0001, partial [uncultured bacterium]
MKADKKGVLNFFQTVCRFNFGDFEKDEFKKFIRLGLMFVLIIGIYWTLRPLKDSIFILLVNKYHLPFAKTISVFALLPLVLFYTRLLEKTSREKMLHILPAFYGAAILLFSFIMHYIELHVKEIEASSKALNVLIIILGYLWYLFVESFGSLVVALFWAYSADTTKPDSAKKGFPLIYAFGQIGGIIFPYFIGGLPYRLGLKTDFLSMIILGLLSLLIIPFFRYFLRSTPKELLVSFHAKNLLEEEKKQEPGFFEGLKLIVKHKYLLGIFAVNFIYEVIVTIFDFNFKIAAGSIYSGVALSNYLSIYGSIVNVVSLSCLL